MSTRWKLWIAVLSLVGLGLGMAYHKSVNLGVPFWRGEQVRDWEIEAKVSFLATGKRVKARLALPSRKAGVGGVMEAGSLGYHYSTQREADETTALWTAEERSGEQSLYFRIRIPEGSASGGEPIADKLDPARESYLTGSVAEAAKTIIGRITSVSKDPESLFAAVYEQVFSGDGTQELSLLSRHYSKEHRDQGRIRMGIDLLEMAGIPARVAYGVKLEPELGPQAPVPLVEYYDGAYWKVRDPMAPGAVLDAGSWFVWHRGGGPLLDLTGGESSKVVFTVVSERVPLSSLTNLEHSPLLISTILGLPQAERAVFRYLVLIPLGAFVVVLLRNIVGIQTLGTFMPVLIALALLEIPPVRAIVMFSVIVALGLWFRFLLSRLNLLVVPRVAACVVIVTLLMMLMSVVAHKMGMVGGGQITLFPMIILAWTIERMSLIWEEEGKRSALVQVCGSLVVALIAYWFMSIGQVQYWAFYFPELLLVLLAAILLIGRYTGYRLSELFRFRSFGHA